MLQGSLENFELSDVLGLLAATSKSGRLRLTGGRGTGSLWLEHGSLVNGIVGVRTDSPIEEMVFELMRFTTGEFAFTVDERSVQAGEPRPVAAVVADAAARLGEWRTIEAVVPSLSHTLEPVDELPAEEMVITRQEWEVLLAVGPLASVDTVCAILGLGEVDGSRQVKELVDRGLLCVGEPAPVASRPAPTAPVDVAPIPDAPVYEAPRFEPASFEPAVRADQHSTLGDDVIDFGTTNGDGRPIGFEPIDAPAPEHRVIEFSASAADFVAPSASESYFDSPAEDRGFVFDTAPEDAGFAAPETVAADRGRTPMPPPPPVGFGAGLGAAVAPPWGEERRAQPGGWHPPAPQGEPEASAGVDSDRLSDPDPSEWVPQADWATESEWTPAAIPAPPAGFAAAGIGAVPPPPPPAFAGAQSPMTAPVPSPDLSPANPSDDAAPLSPSDFAHLVDDGPDEAADNGGGSLLMRYLKSER